MRPQDTAYIIERLAVRFMAMVADHERQLAEHRASFGARTEADEKIIAGLREERDDLLTQVQDMRAEMERLKKPARKHPVAVGEWVKCILTDACDQRHPLYRIGSKGRVGRIVERPNHIFEYHVTIGSDQVWWESSYCIPCYPPSEATHDTPAGKQAAESAVKREPKPGDVVRLVRVPTNDEYPHDSGRWEPNWGGIGDYMRVHHIGNNINGTRIVRAAFGLEWPISCIEIVEDAK